MNIDIKVPTSKEEMEALRKSLVEEISDDDLDTVAGGNDDLKGKGTFEWTCGGCGAVIICKQMQDAAKHMTKCPGNPFK